MGHTDGRADDAVYFVVGAERSGSTLLRLLLTCHPDIAMVGQFEYAVGGRKPDGAEPDPAAFADWLLLDRIFLASGLTIDPSLGYRDLVRDFLEQARAAAGAELTGGVVHFDFDRLAPIWPDAKYIHLVRDGRDVSRSTIGMGWAADLWHGGRFWLESEHLWDRVAPDIPEERRFELRYEDLVREPEATLRGLCAFLGVNFSPRMFDYPEVSDYVAPDPERLDQWRRKLDPEELRLAEARVGDMLVARGYELSGSDRTPPSGWELRRLELTNRWFRIRHRIQLYGLPLWTKEMLTRRLGMDDRWRDYRQEMNQIEQAGLLRVPAAISDDAPADR